MPETIQAIETVYKGYRFRSRLEARWAVFFDALEIDWQYEPQGFETNGKRYLPDFHIPCLNLWCEVKGDPSGLQRDCDRMSDVLALGALPGFHGAYERDAGGLLLLGDVPQQAASGMNFHPLLRHSAEYGLVRCWATFLQSKKPRHVALAVAAKDHNLASMLLLPIGSGLEYDATHEGWLVQTKVVQTPGRFDYVDKAYAAARQARFEHGQFGR